MNGIPHTPLMVRALREGRKWQTRRVVINPQRPCAYRAGQTYYIRESLVRHNGVAWYDDGLPVEISGQAVAWRWKHARLPARFCPAACARGWVTCGEIRREPLQTITDDDARAEGVLPTENTGQTSFPGAAIGLYAAYWDTLHPDTPWDQNPSVDTVVYTRIVFTDIGEIHPPWTHQPAVIQQTFLTLT